MSHRNSASSAKLHPRAQTIWRDKFKQQCRIRLKDARFERMNKNRAGLHISEEDSGVQSSVNHSHINEEDESRMFREIIAAEWEKFKQENLAESAVLMQPDVLEEELMNDLKLMDNDSLYEDMMAYEDNLEESMLRYSMSSSGIERQMYACFHCRSMTMYDTSEGFDCSNCGLKIAVPDGFTLEQMSQRITDIFLPHTAICGGQPIIDYNPNTGLFLLCTMCDSCTTLL